jgi:hypothetical protein
MSDLVQRLRKEANMEFMSSNLDDQRLCKLCGEAADEIERLQTIAGAVTPGQSVSEIKEHLRTLKTALDQEKATNG